MIYFDKIEKAAH